MAARNSKNAKGCLPPFEFLAAIPQMGIHEQLIPHVFRLAARHNRIVRVFRVAAMLPLKPENNTHLDTAMRVDMFDG
jgi:hypothetical protein